MATYWYDIAGPTCLYRAFIGDELAYVGVTCNLLGRFSKHNHQKPWWRRVTWIQTEWYETRAEAFEAEKDAIARENPRYNVARPKAVTR